MTCRLSIRSYSFTSSNHVHDYHQIVFPLTNGVEVDMAEYHGYIAPGMCVVYPAGMWHHFCPKDNTYYLVFDLDDLPKSLSANSQVAYRLSKPVDAFCQFVRAQLEYSDNEVLITQMGDWFMKLLDEQVFLPIYDARIIRVINYLEKDLSATPSLSELSTIAYLSLSQFKLLFKKEVGLTVGQYLLKLRMLKAKSLLRHSNYSIRIIANQLGYKEHSTFTNRFSKYFGFPPSHFRAPSK